MLSGGAVKCWGGNSFGRLGLGDTRTRGDDSGEMGGDLPIVPLGAGRTATAISAGGNHTCALLDNAMVKCWGRNNLGQLGLGNSLARGDGPNEMGDNLPAVNLGTGRTALAVSAGGFHTCALLDNHTVKCWGGNYSGQLGLGHSSHRGDGANEMGDNLPTVALGTGCTATAMALSSSSTCALLDDDSVKCWGSNEDGVLGIGSTHDQGDDQGEMGDDLDPVDLGTGRTTVAIAASFNTACALLDDATVKCWGENRFGALGLGDDEHRGDDPGELGDHLPHVDLGTGRTAAAIVTGRTTCVLLDNAAVKCWGENRFGGLGLGDDEHRGDGPGELGDHLPQVDLGSGRSATAVTTGLEHVCATLDNGSRKCWGGNIGGQLGLGDIEWRGDDPDEMGDNLPIVALTDVEGPALSITKSADQTAVVTGDAIDLHLTVKNPGNALLTNVIITDPNAPDCDRVIDQLSIGEQVSVDCTRTATLDDVGTYSNVATGDSDQTEPVDSNQVDVAVAVRSRPDLTIKRAGGPAIGDDAFGTDGTDQTARAGRERGGRATFYARVGNDGDGPEALNIRRVSSPPGLTIRYFKGRTNVEITRPVVRRTYTTRVLPVGESATIRIEVTVTAVAARGIDHDVLLRARSTSMPTITDTVRARVHVN